jgi:hypothetical protein
LAAVGLLWAKLACQAGFVISFYDLSKTGNRATVQRRTDTPQPESSSSGEQHIDKTEGASPAAFRARPPTKSFVMNAAAEFW